MRTIALLACVLNLGSIANADIVFNFTYSDVNFGFNDPVEGATRRATVEAVANYVNTVVDHNGAVDINWNTSFNVPASSTLASMGAFYFLNDGYSNGFVFEHATTGIDPAGGVDGSGQVNFGRNWNSGLGAPAGNQFDLFTVVLHELTHAMGFASLIEPDGSRSISGTRSVYDSFLQDGAGNPLLNSNGDFIASTSTLTSDALLLDLTASAGGILDVYSPGTFLDGSSISHLDPSVGSDTVMTPSIAPGVQKRTYSQHDLAVLRAIGWNVVAVPEPNGLILLLGISMLFSGRRSRS